MSKKAHASQGYAVIPHALTGRLWRPDIPTWKLGSIRLNLLHFQANYLAMTAALLAALQLNNPLGLCATLLVSVLWALAPQLTSEALSPQRLALLAALSLMVLYLAAGTMLLNLAFMSLLFSGLHAALHPGSVEVGNFDLIDEVRATSADDEVGSPESDSLLKYVPNAAPVGTAWRQASSSRQLSKGSSVEEVAFLEEINPEHVEDDAVLSEKTSPSGRADARAEPEIPTQVGFRHLGCFTCDANHSEASELKASRPQSEAPEMFRGHVPGALCNMVEPHSPRQLAAWKQQEQRNRQFQINISKKGKKLGLRYDDSDGLALVIKIIDPGVLYAARR
eukprot:g13065.t1